MMSFTVPLVLKHLVLNIILMNISIHVRDTEFRCTSCSKEFTEQNSLNRHVKVVHNKEKVVSAHHVQKNLLEKIVWHIT